LPWQRVWAEAYRKIRALTPNTQTYTLTHTNTHNEHEPWGWRNAVAQTCTEPCASLFSSTVVHGASLRPGHHIVCNVSTSRLRLRFQRLHPASHAVPPCARRGLREWVRLLNHWLEVRLPFDVLHLSNPLCCPGIHGRGSTKRQDLARDANTA
jgi:hypothetical protein